MLKKDDLVPDSLPVIGLADDVAVLGLAIKLCEPELEAYKSWKEQSDGSEAAEEIDTLDINDQE